MVVLHLWIALVAYTLVSRACGQCMNCSQVPPPSEINSLLALYDSTAGDQWIHTWNLSTSNPCGGWFGITCCLLENACHVVELKLPANHLVGMIPSDIDGLTVLKTLQLNHNSLNNRIPSSIGDLTALTQLELHSNALTGAIPSTIGNLTLLKVMSLASNNLTGSIPLTIGNLTSLEVLALYSNGLTGTIISSIGNLTSLENLDLGLNSLTGSIPSSIGNLTSLVFLSLDSNNLTGSIPSTIGNLTSLEVLYLDSNDLAGSIPLTIVELTSLKVLSLAYNNLTGLLPPTIGDLASLEVLSLSSNNLTGPLPSTIGNLISLEILQLDSNNLTGSIPSTIGKFTLLKVFLLYSNTLTGSIPPTIGELTSLEVLSFAYNNLRGSIPSTIGNLTLLEILSLASNNLTGSIPSTIGNLVSLRSLYFYSNPLTGYIPSTIGHLASLESLYLYSTVLTGSIPLTIGNLTSLKVLGISSNALTGSIPSTIGNLTSLEGLYLYSNALTGSIPSTIGELTSLGALSLFSNELSRSIPPTIGNLTLLKVLSLYSNALTGSIPSTIGNLTSLQSLYMYSNDLTRSIPSTIGNLTSLEVLYLGSNALTGGFPEVLPTSLVVFIVSDCLLTGMLFPYTLSLMRFLLTNLTGVLSSVDGASLISVDASGNMMSGIAVRRPIPPQLQYLSVADNRIPSWSPALDTLLGHPFVFLDLSSNRLNGSLPATVWITSVQQLLLNSNRFSGTFPDRGDRVCSMQYLSVAGNGGLWGPLPVDLPQCANLTHFFASDMQLTGSVRGLFATQRWLQVVVVSNNSLTGPIDDVFAASSASGLILNAAYNDFSGTLPVTSLRTGRYQSLILTSNCLTGTLPGDALCANGNLTELILSGLHSAASCRYDVFPTLATLGVYSSYVETSAVGGTVPSCLFDGLSQLTYLALSGNALTGTLPSGETLRLPETLQGLDLSHNQLTGTIAAGIVAANLTLLDLSFNRLSGRISAQASEVYARNPAARVSLEVNELSGTLPRSWVEARNISVLYGNLFACEVGRIGQTANRPVHDPRQATYACGSSTTNVALVVTLVVGVGVVLVLLWVRWRGASAAWVVWLLVFDEWSRVVRPLRENALAMVLYLTGSMVVYAVLTETTTVYSETYVWTVSLALQNGVAAGSMALVWLALLVWAGARHTHSALTKMSSSSVSSGRIAISMLLVAVLHVLPVFAVNMVYVYTTTLRLSGGVQAVVVLLMAVFKAAWNTLVNVYVSSDAHVMGNLVSSTHHDVLFARQLLLWCGLINLIVSPVVTEALVSPDCFCYLFSRIQTNSYSIAGGTCYWITYETETLSQEQAIQCMSYSELQQTYNNNVTTFGMFIISTTSNGEASTVDYQAGFAYNFQCSFALLQAFVYVFVYKYLLSGAVLPLLWLMLKRLQTWSYARYGMSSAWYRWTTLCLPPLMKLLDSVEVDGNDDQQDGQTTESNRVRLVEWAKVDQVQQCQMWLSLRLTGDLAVALSFGVLFPMLGLLALLGIGSDVLQTLWMVQRLRAHVDRISPHAMSIEVGSGRTGRAGGEDSSRQTVDQLQRAEYHRVATKQLDALETVVQRSLQSMAKDLLTVLGFAAVTWALTLYDIVGRVDGSVTSLWILVVTLTMPWWMVVLWRAVRHWCTSPELPAIEEEDKGAVELTENPLHDISGAKIESVNVQ